jgi:hypothetical protein
MAHIGVFILIIAGYLTITGMAIFHLLTLFRKNRSLMQNAETSIFLSVVIISVISLTPIKEYFLSFGKEIIFYSIIANYILLIASSIWIIKKKSEFFPNQNKSLKKKNVVAIIIYTLILLTYLFFTCSGLKTGWQAIMN